MKATTNRWERVINLTGRSEEGTTTIMTNPSLTADQLRGKAEENAISAVSCSDSYYARKLWNLAWSQSEQAYDLDNRNEPETHMLFMERMGKAVQRVHGKVVA